MGSGISDFVTRINFQRLEELDRLENSIKIVSGYDLEEIYNLFLKGYVLVKPDLYEKSFDLMSRKVFDSKILMTDFLDGKV